MGLTRLFAMVPHLLLLLGSLSPQQPLPSTSRSVRFYCWLRESSSLHQCVVDRVTDRSFPPSASSLALFHLVLPFLTTPPFLFIARVQPCTICLCTIDFGRWTHQSGRPSPIPPFDPPASFSLNPPRASRPNPLQPCSLRKQLTALGIQPASISFQTLTLESDSFICVRDQNNVVIVDLNNANDVVRRPITADSAVMHPKEKILALKGASPVFPDPLPRTFSLAAREGAVQKSR